MQGAVAQSRANILVAGVAAGLIGGALIDAFLAIANQTNIIQIWQFVASGLVGSAAFSSPSYAALGLAMHFAISIAWALIFAAAAFGPMPTLARQPVIAGLIYGVVVMIGMTGLLMMMHVGTGAAPDAVTFVKSLIAHTVFFGLPVALWVSRSARTY